MIIPPWLIGIKQGMKYYPVIFWLFHKILYMRIFKKPTRLSWKSHVRWVFDHWIYTPWKTNMAPKNSVSQKEIHLPTIHFPVRAVGFTEFFCWYLIFQWILRWVPERHFFQMLGQLGLGPNGAGEVVVTKTMENSLKTVFWGWFF